MASKATEIYYKYFSSSPNKRDEMRSAYKGGKSSKSSAKRGGMGGSFEYNPYSTYYQKKKKDEDKYNPYANRVIGDTISSQKGENAYSKFISNRNLEQSKENKNYVYNTYGNMQNKDKDNEEVKKNTAVYKEYHKYLRDDSPEYLKELGKNPTDADVKSIKEYYRKDITADKALTNVKNKQVREVEENEYSAIDIDELKKQRNEANMKLNQNNQIIKDYESNKDSKRLFYDSIGINDDRIAEMKAENVELETKIGTLNKTENDRYFKAQEEALTGLSDEDLDLIIRRNLATGEEKKDIEAQLLTKYSKKDIKKFDEYINYVVDEEKAGINRENNEAFANERPVTSSITTVGSSLASGVGWLEAIKASLADRPINVNDESLGAYRYTQDVRGKVGSNIDSNIGRLAYNTAMSGADSLVASFIPGVGGAAVLGMGAGVDTMVDLVERGATNEQAITGGIVAGTFESIFENISIGNIDALKEVTPKTMMDIVVNVGKSMGVNFSEESATELANIIYDTLANGDISNYQIAINAYMEQGMSEKEAKTQTAKDFAKQVGIAGLSGLIMGAGFGGIGSAMGYYNNSVNPKAQADATQDTQTSDTEYDKGAPVADSINKQLQNATTPEEKQAIITDSENMDANRQETEEKLAVADEALENVKARNKAQNSINADNSRIVVDYSDKDTRNVKQNEKHEDMLNRGVEVSISQEELDSLSEYYPDLRTMKKKERQPILKQRILDLKNMLNRMLISEFKDKAVEFKISEDNVIEAYVRETGIREVLEKLTQSKAAMLKKTGEIFSNAEYLYSTNDKSNNPNVSGWDYFYTPLNINGDKVGVRIAVRNMGRYGDTQVYNWGIKKGSTLDGVGRSVSSGTNGISSVEPSSDNTISQQENDVNNPNETLNPDLVRRANEASTIFDMGDIIKRQYEKDLATVESLDISDDEKIQAKKKIKALSEDALISSAKSRSMYITGPARATTEQKNGTTARNADNVAEKQQEQDKFVKSLVEKSQNKSKTDKNNKLFNAIKTADKQGYKAVIVNGKTYYKLRKNWTTNKPASFKGNILDYEAEINSSTITNDIENSAETEYNNNVSNTNQEASVREKYYPESNISEEEQTEKESFVNSLEEGYSKKTLPKAKMFNDMSLNDVKIANRIYNGEIVSQEELFNMDIVKMAEKYNKYAGNYLEDEATPTNEQLRYLNEVNDKFLEGAKDKSKDRKAFIIVGLPSSGKSSAVADRLLKENNAFEMDNDTIKSLMVEEFAGGKGANRCQNASSYISDNLSMPKLTKEGTNLVIPIVGKTKKSIRAKYDVLMDAGYDIELYNVELPKEKAFCRATTRALETGRYVSLNYLNSVDPESILEAYNFCKELEGIKRYVRLDNDVERGQSPRSIEDSGTSRGYNNRRKEEDDSSNRKGNDGQGLGGGESNISSRSIDKESETGALRNGFTIPRGLNKQQNKGINLKIKDEKIEPKYEGKEKSNLYESLMESDLVSDEAKQKAKENEDIRFYQRLSNDEALRTAKERLYTKGEQEVNRWFAKNENHDAVDVAEGLILMKLYQDNGQIERSVDVMNKLREIGTKSGQAVQAFSLLNRLTPEGMLYYAQNSLDEIYEKEKQYRNAKWIEENKEKFKLTQEEADSIKARMEIVQSVDVDSYAAKVQLAHIQKIINSKIPTTTLKQIKGWARLSMLYNPKTLVRNFTGNLIMSPSNVVVDLISPVIDKAIAKKTGQRTSGGIKFNAAVVGFKEGGKKAWSEYRQGIDTRDVGADKFEFGNGATFSQKTAIGRVLNKIDNNLNFLLDLGDRPFYESAFKSKLTQLMQANNTTEATAEMLETANDFALERTWQDNNAFTRSVMGLRDKLNFGKEYGFGSIVMPFAKTPANLTKAIIDYSPVGLIKTITADAAKINRLSSNGVGVDMKMQRRFVDNVSKGITGTLTMAVAYALMEAGILKITGGEDDDYDLASFDRNIGGKQSYSIKIGDKWYKYDWAQPFGTNFAIAADIKKSLEMKNGMFKGSGYNVLNSIINAFSASGDVLFQQSFAQGIQSFFQEQGLVQGLIQVGLDMPTQFVPTLLSQFASLVDDKNRTTYVYGNPLKTMTNKVKAKIPFLSKTLPESVDVMGNVTLRYNGDNNVWNVFFNPANVQAQNGSKATDEIYRLYEEVGDKSIIPRVAPYYINNKGETYILTPEERLEWQKTSGRTAETEINRLLASDNYKGLSDREKCDIMNEIISYTTAKSKYEYMSNSEYVDEYKMPSWVENIDKAKEFDISPGEYIIYKSKVSGLNAKDSNGNSINGLKKKRVKEAIWALNATEGQKWYLYAQQYPINDSSRGSDALFDYIDRLPISKKEKQELYDSLVK